MSAPGSRGPQPKSPVSPTKQLISRFNTDKAPVPGGGPTSKVRSPTKSLINKWSKPEELFWTGQKERTPTQAGFQGVQALHKPALAPRPHAPARNQFVPVLTETGDLARGPTAAPRGQMTPSKVSRLVSRLNLEVGEEEDGARASILKRNCGLSGWQAADI